MRPDGSSRTRATCTAAHSAAALSDRSGPSSRSIAWSRGVTGVLGTHAYCSKSSAHDGIPTARLAELERPVSELAQSVEQLHLARDRHDRGGPLAGDAVQLVDGLDHFTSVVEVGE